MQIFNDFYLRQQIGVFSATYGRKTEPARNNEI